MKIRLTSKNAYTIFNFNEVAIGSVTYDHIINQWIASISGKIVATGSLSCIARTLVL